MADSCILIFHPEPNSFAEAAAPATAAATFGEMTLSDGLVDLAYGSAYSMSYKILNRVAEEDADVDLTVVNELKGKVFYDQSLAENIGTPCGETKA